jgi:hypothetical protein
MARENWLRKWCAGTTGATPGEMINGSKGPLSTRHSFGYGAGISPVEKGGSSIFVMSRGCAMFHRRFARNNAVARERDPPSVLSGDGRRTQVREGLATPVGAEAVRLQANGKFEIQDCDPGTTWSRVAPLRLRFQREARLADHRGGDPPLASPPWRGCELAAWHARLRTANEIRGYNRGRFDR